MTRSFQAGSIIVVLAVGVVVGQVADAPVKDTPKLKEEVLAAWKKAGAIPAWVRLDNGVVFVAYNPNPKNDTPGFTFRTLKGVKLSELPDPGIDFFINSGRVTGGDFKALSKFKGLRTLVVVDGATDTEMRAIGGLKSLRQLVVESSREVTDAGVEALGGLTDLEYLDLNGPLGMTDKGMKAVGKLKRLKTLRLSTLGISGRGLSELAGLTSVERLLLFEPDFKDEDLAPIAKLTGLRQARISSFKLTDAAVNHFAKLPALRKLTFATGTPVTEKGLEELRKALPDADIR
jgi:hypothetical protein